MNKRKFTVVFLVILIPISICLVDYSRALHDSPPIFAFRTHLYKDGGTSVYVGFCYKVIDYNKIDGRKDVVFKSIFISKGNE